ncbi:MAG: alpha/beta hydrolase [Bacteroidota bacterium]
MKSDYLELFGKKVWVVRVEVSEAPDGPTLVFLHDALGCAAKWKAYPEKVCQRLGMNGIVYDRWGHGKSDPMKEERLPDYLEKEALQVLPELLAACNITQPVLYGYSDGGSIALIYAAHHQPLAMVTAAAHVKVEDITLEGVKQVTQVENLAMRLAKYHGTKAAQLMEDWPRIWQAEERRQWNIESLLPQIACPTLVVQGALDEFATPQHMHDIAQQIGPHAEALLVDGVGHELHRDAEEQMLEAATRFIAKALD